MQTLKTLKTIAAAALVAGTGLWGNSAQAVTYNAWGNPGSTSTAVTITNITLVTPYDPVGGFDCGNTRATTCNPAHSTSGALGTYNPTGASNPHNGSSPEAEVWYLAQLLNDQTLASSSYNKQNLGAGDPGKSSVFTILAASLTGYSHLVFKYDGEWAFFSIDDTSVNVTVNGLPNGLSHYTLIAASPIPLPAGGLLLITALGGLGYATRRRRKAA